MSLSNEQRATAYATLILGAVTGAITMLAELFGHAIGSPIAQSTPGALTIYFVAFSVAAIAMYAKAASANR